jgi:phosphatidyl-myo-inositol dimannoside synthase
LYEYGLVENAPIKIMSMHDGADAAEGNKYFPDDIFEGYNAAKASFILSAINEGRKSKVVILSHINLLIAAWLIKKISPTTKVILMAHGIEVWKPLEGRQKMMLGKCDIIASVSSFTSNKIQHLHNIAASKCKVLNNCIDPFLARPKEKYRHADLVNRYGIKNDDIVLLTLTRLSFKDRYKGYNFVLEALEEIVKSNKQIKYILAGSYEAQEKEYIDTLIDKYYLHENVIITGFIKEAELAAHFSLADIYVMPSVKEGFGIVFVEAMYYGVPVIAGNVDGSTDALLQGKLGLIIEPDSPEAIKQAIQKMIANRNDYLPDYKLLMSNFGYEAYKGNLERVLKFEGVSAFGHMPQVNFYK